MSYTLGLSYGFHDASAALVGPAGLIAAASEERFSRQKHDAHFPFGAVRHCLETAGIVLDDVGAVYYHENPGESFTRIFAGAVSRFPRGTRVFTESMKAWLKKKLWVENEISKKLDVHHGKVRTLNHHASHAAQAFLGSGFDEAAILTVDSVGEWASVTLARGEWHGGVPKLTELRRCEYPSSLGLVYSSFTAFLGFAPMDGECSTMALAAFGEPVYAAEIGRLVRYSPRDGLVVDPAYFDFGDLFEMPFTPAFLAAFGAPRDPADALPFSCFAGDGLPVARRHRRFADVAASIQRVYEDVVAAMVADLVQTAGSRNLCFAGGGALNCVANSALLGRGLIDDLYVPPDPGDGGAAVGAALLGHYQRGERTTRPRYQPYLGEDAAENDVEMRSLTETLPQVTARKAANVDDLARDTAALIAAGKIVGWCQGRFENGPRALGSRSILIRPDDEALAKTLSTRVKVRAAYRPYALSLTDAAAQTVFGARAAFGTPWRWMQLAEPVAPAVLASVRAAVHVDGTTRPQVCYAADHPRYHALLTAVGAHTGLEAVLNTSFNESGFPLVNTATQAAAMFAGTAMDALVIGDWILEKRA